MTVPLEEQIKQEFGRLTKAEKAVASYVLANLNSLPFETAASIADTVGVSQMTVGRFLRSLGYRGLSDLKEKIRTELDATPLLISDRIARIRSGANSSDKLLDNFELEVKAILGVYELRGSNRWHMALDHLDVSSDVFVAGFQTISGIASDFAGRLDYVRPNVTLIDGTNGTFSELFMRKPETSCLVLFEMRRYTKLAQQLARAAREHSISIIVICDSYCHWAHDHTETVLPVRTDSNLFWDSQAPFVSLTGLLLDDLIARRGHQVAARVKAMRDLQDRFGAFDV